MKPLARHALSPAWNRPLVELPVAGPRRRPHWLGLRRVRIYAAAVLACQLLFAGIYLYRLYVLRHPGLSPLALDFLPTWSASWLALHGHGCEAWQLDRLAVIEQGVVPSLRETGGQLPWLYPPFALLLMQPVALLPYPVAAVVWSVGTGLCFVAAIRAIVPRGDAVFLVAAFPAALLAAAMGQSSLLTAALAATGLTLLRRRPVVAGICFGMLFIKPHLALLFPLALLCSRAWRALAALLATVGTLFVLGVIAFGADALSSFVANVGMMARYVQNGPAPFARMPTFFAMAKLLHSPSAIAYAAQGASALLAASIVVLAWTRESAYGLRAAALVGASLLVSPYLYDYDLTWYAVFAAWLARHALAHGWRAGERECLAALWLMPLAGLLVVSRAPLQFVPLVTLAAWGLVVARMQRERRESPCLPVTDDAGLRRRRWP
ncbi:glycosyltransferase family 87 protein [Paraburkholderia kururiensis]|uniref:Glycosyltransferase family 87 protein n=1 Tax=Paraburkholderia kururiensis TaxID=984307 RepID=A0ABZ0WPL1_9BURK|nr:glycosyltransferase family 87 protein [Paraburkholderia kururiensis]WQD79234.1 glycosyltransferase family 87 protein [Paraburkholderia kururiensis]